MGKIRTLKKKENLRRFHLVISWIMPNLVLDYEH